MNREKGQWRKRSLPYLLAGLTALGTSGKPGAAPVRPNIVFILVDDLRWDEIGCAGHPFVRTPNIDRLAEEGVRFGKAFATTPLCSPSRASFLTGLYAHSHGIIDNTDRSALSHQLKTFPLQLQSTGYETAYIGKWHMGNDDTRRPGFDYWVSIKGQGETTNPVINDNGRRTKVSGYITDILTDRAVAFIKPDRSQPFLLYLAHKALHPNLIQYDDGSISDPTASVFIPAERHKDLYAGLHIPRRRNAFATPKGKPALQRKIGNLPPLGPDTSTSDQTIRDRLRMLTAVDESLGRILQALEQTRQLDNTVVVFTSDHGYFYGEHGLSVERRLAYEEAIRIPLLMRYPSLIKAGSTQNELVLSIDLAPTLLDISGNGDGTNLHGRSLVPLLERPASKWRNSFLIEYFSDRVFPRIENMGYQAVRTKRFKYIHYTELDRMDELYDLEADPYEMANLTKEAGAAAILKEMKAELEKLLKEPGAASPSRGLVPRD